LLTSNVQAFNLLSKRYAAEPSSQFVVCDALPKASEDFCANIRDQFPGILVEVAQTPSE
jgi:3-hydroxyisobutyrate dehydrogenase